MLSDAGERENRFGQLIYSFAQGVSPPALHEDSLVGCLF